MYLLVVLKEIAELKEQINVNPLENFINGEYLHVVYGKKLLQILIKEFVVVMFLVVLEKFVKIYDQNVNLLVEKQEIVQNVVGLTLLVNKKEKDVVILQKHVKFIYKVENVFLQKRNVIGQVHIMLLSF